MTRPTGQKIVCSVVLAVAVLAAGVGVRGCGNPGEGTVKVAPEVRARLGKGPEAARAASGKTRAEPTGIKQRIRKNAGVN
jgi:hypothetical protein